MNRKFTQKGEYELNHYFSKRDKHAKKCGLDKMSVRDIDAEVSEVRKRR